MSTVKLIHLTPNYMEIIAGAMGKCYDKKVGLTGVLKSLEAGHLSILEHAHATFDIEASLAFLGQITRHRHLSFTVQSTRGTPINKIYLPDTLQSYGLEELLDKVYATYMQIIDDGEELGDAAYIMPKGSMTKIRVTGNLRAWYEYLPKRLCQRASDEHRHIAQIIHTNLILSCPEIFSKDLKNCENCKEKGCSF